ncbi:hypothetical protein H5410_056765 [Solanum commersonii]|uniref:Uncharacterized protein n=1 Tax=Solanum commersonii TaxID=4109 RepID=A0A9J5WN65_SOLCO|nr:hypothetical protein H5410_056765 [Solanum commersonii]
MKFEGSDIVRSLKSKIEARGSLELIHFVLKYLRIEENHKGEKGKGNYTFGCSLPELAALGFVGGFVYI